MSLEQTKQKLGESSQKLGEGSFGCVLTMEKMDNLCQDYFDLNNEKPIDKKQIEVSCFHEHNCVSKWVNDIDEYSIRKERSISQMIQKKILYWQNYYAIPVAICRNLKITAHQMVQFSSCTRIQQPKYALISKYAGKKIMDDITSTISNSFIQELKMNRERVYDFIYHLFNSIQQLHQHHIYHLDIRLYNILYDFQQPISMKLIDFGLSTYLPPDEKQQ